MRREELLSFLLQSAGVGALALHVADGKLVLSDVPLV